MTTVRDPMLRGDPAPANFASLQKMVDALDDETFDRMRQDPGIPF